MRGQRPLTWLAVLAAAFAFAVVMFGAFVRLSDAGLSCPDWPTCYGQVTWPVAGHEIASADAAFPHRPVEAHKAWREQVHRFLAGGLGVMVLVLALAAAWRSRWRRAAIAVAALAAAAGTVAWITGHGLVSSLAAGVALVLPVVVAATLPRPPAWRLAALAFAVIVFQAMLGMWTVTWLLKPVVVMGHLLGGLLLLGLLMWIALRFLGVGAAPGEVSRLRRRWLTLGIIVLAAQLALGGWTSANYAAAACGFGDPAFPQCLAQWWPAMDFREGFVLWRGIGVDYEGGVLDASARTAIQMTHRIGALVVLAVLGWLAARLWRVGLRPLALLLGGVLLAQVGLGIANVHYGLPLAVAVAHNGVAALLLFSLLLAVARLTPRALDADPDPHP